MEALNKFLYTEASLEIFGHADQLHDNVVTKLNNFITDIIDEEKNMKTSLLAEKLIRNYTTTLFFLQIRFHR
jgi:hypothetical protein